MKVYSEEYSSEYHMMLQGQVERRMRSAVITIGSMWYTAWVNAGQPDLSKFMGNYTPSVEDLDEIVEKEQKPDSIRVRDHE
jgi:hypothetical protein